MKGLLLFFMLFGLGVTLGNDGDGTMTVTDLAPAIELPANEDVTAYSEEQTTEAPVSEEKEEGYYEAEVKVSNILAENVEQYLYVENGVLYSFQKENNGDNFSVAFLSKDLKTGEHNIEVEFEVTDVSSGVFFVHPSNEGGYFALASNWTENGADYWLMTFDEDGTFINKKRLNDVYKMPKGFYITNKLSSDGTYIYCTYADYSSAEFVGGILIFDLKGNFVKVLTDSGEGNPCVGNDGLLYMITGDYYNELKAYYPDNNEFTECLAEADEYCGGGVFNGDDGELLFGNQAIYSYDCKTNTLNKLLTFVDSDNYVFSIDFMYRDGNGDIVIIYEDYTDDSYTSVEAYEARFSKK